MRRLCSGPRDEDWMPQWVNSANAVQRVYTSMDAENVQCCLYSPSSSRSYMTDHLSLASSRNNGLGISACGRSSSKPKGSTIATARFLLQMARRYSGSLWFAPGTRLIPLSPFSCCCLNECTSSCRCERMSAQNEGGLITVASPVMVSPRQCRAVLQRSQASTLGSTGYCTDPQLTRPAASQHSWGTQAVMRDNAAPPSDAWP